MTAEKQLLKWTEIKKSFGEFEFQAAPGEVKRGEVVGIFGPNGIGKTTFVKVLAGLEEADSGETSADEE